jgi:hypothetical protein
MLLLVSFLAHSLTLKMQVVPPKRLALRTAWRYNPEDRIIHSLRRENLKPITFCCLFYDAISTDWLNDLTEVSNHKHLNKKRQSYPCNRPWRPIGLRDIEAPTFSRQSAHKWRWGQPYPPAALYHQEDCWYLFMLEGESTPRP